jgi:hypothetical protein
MSAAINIKTNEQIVRERLQAEGFSGLYVPGECGCHLGDFAICGDTREDANGYINGCKPGHLIRSDSNPSDWLVHGSLKSMSQADIDAWLKEHA